MNGNHASAEANGNAVRSNAFENDESPLSSPSRKSIPMDSLFNSHGEDGFGTSHNLYSFQGNLSRLHSHLLKGRRKMPLGVIAMGLGLLFVLMTSFLHVFMLGKEYREGHTLNPMSHSLRSFRLGENVVSNERPFFRFNFLHSGRGTPYKPLQRRRKNEDHGLIPILIANFDNSMGYFEKGNALPPGKKLFRRKLGHKIPSTDEFPEPQYHSAILTPDNQRRKDKGGLKMKPVKDFNVGRKMKEDQHALSGRIYTKEDVENSKYVDSYYAFDDDAIRSHHFHNDNCKRTSWHKFYFPTCNNFHEMDMRHDDSQKVGSGYYRTVFTAKNPLGHDFALKTLKYKHDFKFDNYEFIRLDALVMERLTSSPRIVDAYGHCGTTVMTEQLEYDVERYIITGSGYPGKHGLRDKHDVNPQNDYSVSEKLEMALEMALAIGDLHSFEGGVIVHDDIQLSQFLINSEGKLKLNDFNRAEVMLYDAKHKQYCRYRNGSVYGNYRAPEEFSNRHLNEKIDVWSMGNNIYALLTGLWVYYDTEDDQEVQKVAAKGKLPYIDPRYRTRSFAEGMLVEIMERCWEYEPDNRADIFEVSDFLTEAVKENRKLLGSLPSELSSI